MHALNPTNVSEEDVFQLAQLVFDAVLQMPMERLLNHTLIPRSDPVSAMVRVSGAWDGQITLHCSRALAVRAASIMFAIPEAEVGASETLDALGELTNMVGGNVKALIPSPSQLSLPCLGTQADQTHAALKHATRVSFSSADGLCGSASVCRAKTASADLDCEEEL